MPKAEFDPLRGVILLGDLSQLTAPSAGREEICDQGLVLIARALGARGGIVFVREDPQSPPKASCRCGKVVDEEAATVARSCIASGEPVEEKKAREGAPSRVGLPLPGELGTAGVLVLDHPAIWDPAARVFALSAARILGSSLRAHQILGETHLQGELLARRNVELEVLREMAGSLQGLPDAKSMLQAALDLVLEKLGLEAGWVLWGESSRGDLELAASRGISESFVSKSRTTGIGECLCRDVFETGRLRFARNTTECPRMPELIEGAGNPVTHACIPLKFERGTLGVMNIANRPGRVFSPQELQFLETVGNQVCLAVDKSRTARAESRRNAEARALSSLAAAIGGSLDEKRVLSAAGEYTRELLGADRCLIFLGEDPSSLKFAYLAGAPVDGMEVGRTVDLAALGSRAFAGALRQRSPLVIHDALNDPRANADLARRWKIVSTIVVPIVAHDRLGGLLIAGRDAPSAWSEDEVQLTGALAGQAAVAIESARLYREAQEALLRLQQAQYGMMRAERLAAVGTLASSLAHEVRNPLNSINLQLVLLSRRVAKIGEPMQAELGALLDTARREIARLDGLVEEFLSLSSIDRVSLTENQPEEVVREVVGLMTPVARDRNIAMDDETASSLPRIPMDREKIKQVLINLVRNAIEAMPDGGILKLSAQYRDGHVVMEVADTGTGIEPGVDIFDFFVTTKRGGTGLGLPIARRIVEAHGGSMSYESEPGRGTTFTVSLKAR
jgi:two-component system sensor histidine kinase HydH